MLNADVRQLEYFVAAADAGSYSSAAKVLYVSPQAVSKSVQALERHLGVMLFDRGPNGISLTEFGRQFRERASELLDAFGQLEAMADDYRHQHTEAVSVGIHSLCFREHGGTIDWNDLLLFHEEHCEIDTSFIEMRGGSIVEDVAKGSLDFGISVLPTECPVDVDGILLRSFPLAALVSGDRFLAGKQQVSIEDLRTGQLVLFSEEDSFNNRLIEEAAKEQVVYDVSPLRIRADSDMGFLLNRNLFSVRPLQHARRTTMSDAMRILPIVNGKGESVEIALYLIWHQSRLLSESDRTLIDVIAGMYRPV